MTKCYKIFVDRVQISKLWIGSMNAQHFTDNAGENALNSESNNEGNVTRVSTRLWAESCGYDPEKLFTKLFHDDIKYLLSMDNLWKNRRPPTPLEWKILPDKGSYLR